MAMIKFDHVDKYYGKFHALKISISNSRKEKLSLSLVLLVQERALMLRCINGLETISSGKLLINDTDLHDKRQS